VETTTENRPIPFSRTIVGIWNHRSNNLTKMSLTAEQIAKNWSTFRSKINLFPGREAELNTMYDHFEERIMMMPASGTEYYHNAFAGGYVDHVLRVMDCTETLYDIWKSKGADVSGFTLEELLFAAMHHDLGKAGFPGQGQEVYIPNDSEWHRKNQGKIYKHNPNIPFTLVPDLSLWTLQEFGVHMSWNEYQTIRIHDGMYDEANRAYFLSRSQDSKLKTNMALILHHADHMAATIEYDAWKNNRPIADAARTSVKGGRVTNSEAAFDISNLFG
jgi:hypothetical protein